MGIMQKNNRLKGLTRLLLLLGFSIASMSAGAQTLVTSLYDITANGNYRLDADIDASGFEGFSFTFSGTLDGGYHTISSLTQPLFTTVDGGTVKNLVLDKVHIASGTNVGAVCGTATGSARIYNCGVQSSDGSSSLAGTTVGGLVGTIAEGSNVRVVNCYSYATVTGGTYAAGIVGRNQGTVSGTTTVSATGVRIAMCMMYGDMTLTIKGGSNIDYVFGGSRSVAAENHVGGYAINGNVTLILKGGTIANAFGGSDTKGNIKGDVRVLVDDAEDAGCPLKVDNVYGGGKDAAYVPEEATAATPTVDVVNGTVNNAVFGGGLGAGATVTANPTVNIGGTGANRAVVGGRLIDDSADGKGDVFGGGSEADVLKDGDNTGNTSVTLSGNAEVMGNVYGGGNVLR